MKGSKTHPEEETVERGMHHTEKAGQHSFCRNTTGSRKDVVCFHSLAGYVDKIAPLKDSSRNEILGCSFWMG